ncbi:hypothetical protein VPH35_091042 [Triticum aestivum]|uniref:F-box domain-containing protein n=1 Tax=Triticum aestivum TaxID=4565 RepID=A0A3B6LN00_WHEAT|nr:uncharacterized protein LOC123112511 isoform X1 [Triticum aestivum]
MGLLAINRLVSMQPDWRRRPTQGRNGLVTSSVAKRKGSPCSLHDDNSGSVKKSRCSGPGLPEDIWHHIYSLLPLRDAARVACVSHTFKSYWRHFPNLSLTRETLGLDDGVDGLSCPCEIAMDLARKTDHIFKNHSGIGVKALKLEICGFPFFNNSCDLDRWLHIAVKPGIKELDLKLLSTYVALCPKISHATICPKISEAAFCRKKIHTNVYNFPCSLLDGSGKSIQQLHLNNCALRPTTGLGRLRSLTSLEFFRVRITEDELRCLFSSSIALEKLVLRSCNELSFLEIPSLLQRLNHLVVMDCGNLEVIKSKAPNLYIFHYGGTLIPLSLGDSLQNLCIGALLGRQDVVHYPWADLLRMVPHLEDLEISSYCVRDTLVVPGKFLHLQCLCIGAFNPDYDYLSLVSFLDACPSLETFILSVDAGRVRQESVLGESSHDLRQMPGHVHRNIKDVVIIGFCSAKSMVELTCHMLENAKSLEYLTLNTSSNPEILCSDSENGRCLPMSKHMRMEARRALLAVGRFILGKVPCSVELEVVKPCSRCNSLEI